MAQYRSHIQHTIGYMNEYLQQFHNSKKIFAEFRAFKYDREKAAKVAEEIAEGQAQSTSQHYFKLNLTQQAKKRTVDRVENQETIYNILQQSIFNFPKLNYLSHYGCQISDFGTFPQYSNEITKALHKPLNDAYRRSNRVDAVEQVLDSISRDDALQMKELNLIAWSRDIKLPIDIQTLLGIGKGKVAPEST